MSHPFGDQVSQLIHRKHGLSLSKLAVGINQPHSVVSLMCKGQRLTGPQARERVVAIIRWLYEQHALTTLDDANGVLRAAGMADLDATRPDEARLLRLLPTTPPAEPTTTSAPAPEPPKEPTPPRSQLPTPITSFIGRQREIAEVLRLLDQPGTRLLSLTGTGGSGKTRLALQIAHERQGHEPDGSVWVELAPLADPALVSQAVVAALGLHNQAGQRPTDLLIATLRPRRLLLALDNCEHLIDACAGLVETLLLACPDLTILTTSREELGLTGEVVWPVPSLSFPAPQEPAEALARTAAQYEAVQLFVERAAARRPGFALTRQSAATVAQICQRLDGIPLALELAAARVKVLALEQLAMRLDDSLGVLTDGSRTAPPRQQTLRATIDWSYALLSEPECALLRRLAIFHGGCTLAAAEAVCAGEGLKSNKVLDLLARLVEKSLIQVEQQGDTSEARYRLLVMIRQYALERLIEAGEQERIADQHLRCYLALAEHADRTVEIQGPKGLRRLEPEEDNLRAALAWARDHRQVETGARLASALGRFWLTHGRWHEGRAWLQEMRALAHDLPVSARGRLLLAEARLAEDQGDLSASVRLASEALALWQGAGDETGIAEAQARLGKALLEQGDFAQARRLLEAALTFCRTHQDTRQTAALLTNLALLEFRAPGDFERAGALFEESAALRRELGDLRSLGWTIQGLGIVRFHQGAVTEGITLLNEALALHRQIEDWLGIAFEFYSLGWLALLAGEAALAAGHFQESLTIFQDQGIGSNLSSLHAVAGLAVAAQMQGDLTRAARLFGSVEALVTPGDLPMLRLPELSAVYDQAVVATRAALGETVYTFAWAEGHALTLEQVVAAAFQHQKERTASPGGV